MSILSKRKYTNPAIGILDFCKQKLWPLPNSQKKLLTQYGDYGDSIPDPVMVTQYDAMLDPVMLTHEY